MTAASRGRKDTTQRALFTIMMSTMHLCVSFLAVTSLTQAFAPATSHVRPSSSTTTALHLDLSQAGMEAMQESRTAFFIWFFGASGAAGIARSALPGMFDRSVQIRKLKGQGPTLGGDKLGISPLVGYPEDLSRDDVAQVVNNPLSVEQIVEKYPVEGNFMAEGGYLTYASFCQANQGANPLAVRAVFDTFAQSTNACNPEVAQEKLDSYKEELDLVKPALLKSKFTGWAALATLLGLLGMADIIAAGHAYNGWFPDWPGGKDFPACLLDKATGPWTIPDYWVGDLDL